MSLVNQIQFTSLSYPVLLASTSVYREALLKKILPTFSSAAPLFDETNQKNLPSNPFEKAYFLAKGKAESLKEHYPNHLIIASDQICFFNQVHLHKPGTHEKALEQLMHMQGKTHQLITAVYMYTKDRDFYEVQCATLKMKTFSEQTLDHYLKLDTPYNCAGAYKWEEHGMLLFESVTCDDHTGIIGLPLSSVGKGLKKWML
jgi:septum formation protein